MSSSQLGLCVVGPGGIAAAHAKALQALGDVRFEWVVGREESSAETFAREWGFARHTTELESPSRDPGVDVVLIASPNELHLEQARQALEAEKHVIVEIPAAMSFDGALELKRLSKRVGRRVLVCHTMRSYPAIREVRRRVQDGTLTVSQVTGFFAVPRRANENWAGGTRSWVDNLLWHHACHQVDAALWTLGIDQADHVRAQFGRSHPQFGMTMDLSVSFRTPARQVVTHTLTYNTAREVWLTRFVGDEALLIYQDGALLDDEGREVIPAMDWSDLRPQDQDMLAAIRGEAESDYSIESVLPAMRVLQDAELEGTAEC
jgi:2-hydroxy-4-carboxymuconate semialdehyde hemiacetal dehydrogenase